MIFYSLGGKSIRSWVRSVEGKDGVIINGFCSKCSKSYEVYSDTIKIDVIGTRLFDIYSNFFFLIVSERFRNIVEKNRLTGMKFVEVEVNQYLNGNRKSMNIEEKLYKMTITGRTGMWRDADGDLLEYCDECKRVIDNRVDGLKGYGTNEEEWDGSNFFMYSNKGRTVMIDEKAYKVLKKAKLKNIEMKQLEKCREF